MLPRLPNINSHCVWLGTSLFVVENAYLQLRQFFGKLHSVSNWIKFKSSLRRVTFQIKDDNNQSWVTCLCLCFLLQFIKRPTEAGFLCCRPHQTDVHAAAVVQSDAGAAAVLLRWEESNNQRGRKNHSHREPGHLRMS